MNNKILSKTRQIIPYVKELRKLESVSSASTAILMQQLDYWFDKTGQGFYKFLAPCNHPAYEQGDSWTEELGFSEKEFRTAFKNIGVKYNNKTSFEEQDDPFQGKYYCSYTNKREGKTYYFRNNQLVDADLDRVFTESRETPDGHSGKLRSVTSSPARSESPDAADGNLPNLPTGRQHLYTEITPENTAETTRDYAHGETRPQEQLNVQKIPEQATGNGSAQAVNPDFIDSLNNQDPDRGKFSADPQGAFSDARETHTRVTRQNQLTGDASDNERLILPKEQQRSFWRALTAYIEKTNPKMSRGRAESIASASTERLLNQVPKVQDQEYLEMYLQGILPCYTDRRINHQTIKEHQTLEELRGMLYDE